MLLPITRLALLAAAGIKVETTCMSMTTSHCSIVRNVFGDKCPLISSTKSLSGHSLGAAGVHEAIYSLLMMETDFIAASCNIQSMDEAARDLPILLKREDRELDCVMSNSFGFGGTNSTLIFEKLPK